MDSARQSRQEPFPTQVVSWVVVAVLVVGVSLTRLSSYLLFHGLAEVFSVVVACSIFVLFWNARQFVKNGAFLFLGIGFLFVGLLELLHMLSYRGMPLFREDANPATQLWVAARLVEAGTFLAAALAVRRMPGAVATWFVFAATTGLLVASIFWWRVFPACWVDDVGLTPFKVASEYGVCLVFLASAALFWRRRSDFDPGVIRLLLASIAATIAAELAFTLYHGVEDLANMAGHLMKLVAFYLIYKAMIEVGFRRPYDLLFRDLKRGEESLRKSEERYRTLAEFTFDWEQWIGPDGRFLYVSPSCLRITGHRAEEFLKDPSLMVRVTHEDDRPTVAAHFHDALDRPEPMQIQFRVLDGDGHVRWIEHVCQPVYAADGESLGRRCSNRDVTGRVLAEQAAKEARQRVAQYQRQAKDLAEAELAKVKDQLVRQTRLATIGQIAASIAHDVRNPLAAMRFLTQALRGEAAGVRADWCEYLDQIDAEIESTNRIVGNLMEMAHAKDVQKQPVDLAGLLGDVARQLGLRDWVHWNVEVDPAGLIVSADPTQLRLVLGNLAANAAQAMGGRGEIRVHARREHAADVIDVEDDGPGVPSNLRDDIFEPLVTSKPKGTGLGLAICRQILERHGGSLELCDTNGRGARFRIRLPAEQSPEEVHAGNDQ
jgi:hypothetical protein